MSENFEDFMESEPISSSKNDYYFYLKLLYLRRSTKKSSRHKQLSKDFMNSSNEYFKFIIEQSN